MIYNFLNYYFLINYFLISYLRIVTVIILFVYCAACEAATAKLYYLPIFTL